MTKANWQRALSIFESVADLTAAELDATLQLQCAGDAELRACVESLLAEDRAVNTLLDVPLGGVVPGYTDDVHHIQENELSLPTRIGPFRIIHALGAGRSGIVYLAEEDSPRRHVALKILRSGEAIDPQSLRQWSRRFAREAQTLALLRHEGIARYYSSGTTPLADGTIAPYIAMEPVLGQPITRFCRDRRLAVKTRLALFMKVCRAIQYAHQCGVIHADLSSANIYVESPVDEHVRTSDEPTPKILDFGLARLIRGHTGHTSTGTRFAGALGTLAYMAPELAEGDPDRIDTRSDVYSLGAILYELLTDRPPFEFGDLSVVAAIRIAHGVSPPAPSRACADITRGRLLRGDLDSIVLKCLEKSPADRYHSVAQLMDDIHRVLSGLPISSRTGETLYVIRSMIRRNRATAVSALAGLLMLLSIIAILAWATQSIRSERDTGIEAIRSLLRLSGEQLHDRDGLDENRRRLLTDLRPYVERFAFLLPDDDAAQRDLATILECIGGLDILHGRPDRAKPLLDRAITIRELLLKRAKNSLDRKHATEGLSIALVLRGDAAKERHDLAGMRIFYRRALDFDQSLADEFSDDVRILNNLGFSFERWTSLLLWEDNYSDAEEIISRAIAISDRLVERSDCRPSDRWLWCSVRLQQALVLQHQSRITDAVRLVRSTIDPLRRLVSEFPDNFTYGQALNHALDGEIQVAMKEFRFKDVISLAREQLAEAESRSIRNPTNYRVLNRRAGLHCSIAKAFIFLGDVHETIENVNSAERILRAANAISPNLHEFDLTRNRIAALKAGIVYRTLVFGW